MVKQTNKEWLEQEVEKLGFKVLIVKTSNVLEFIKDNDFDFISYNINTNDFYFQEYEIIKVNNLKQLIAIAEEYKTRIENDE